ncbi:10462_t:CDS:10, partial [Acaulospora colombiana]
MEYRGDWEPEVDYSGHQWFTNLPPKAKTPPPAPSPKPTYIPEPAIVDRNTLFVYALKSAPDVLMEQYKHFGQLGVLGWCSEFSELIDELKEFGHMFTDTRDQALETCTNLLDALVNHMEVQRLRKFLDANTEFDDYPQPDFPIQFYQRKRKLTEDEDTPYRRKKHSLSSISAVLSTVNSEGIIDIIQVDRPLTIGMLSWLSWTVHSHLILTNRSPSKVGLRAQRKDSFKSALHNSRVSMYRDFSSNGIIVNSHPFTKRRSILLMDGDYLQISGSQVFHCEQVRREGSQSNLHVDRGLAEIQVCIYTCLLASTSLNSTRGAYSAVNLAIDLKEHRQVACKIIQQRSQADITDVLREPNINAVYGFSSSEEALQPENILLATPGAYPRILIADFGLAKERAFELTGNVAGTISYLPPEAVTALARKTKYNTEMSDSWALGLIIFIMLQSVPWPFYLFSSSQGVLFRGYHPFDSRRKAQISSYPINNCGEPDTPHQSEEIVRRRIVQKVGILHWSDWQGLSLGKDLVSKLLVRDAKHRQTVGAAMDHDWIRQDLPSLMKAYNKLVVSE